MEHRLPLRDVGTNSPRVKRQKANPVVQQQDFSLAEWQRKWRSIMTTSVVYFDITDGEGKRNEKERAVRLFQTVGASMQQFFDGTVTVVVSRRPKHELPKNMVSKPALKIWDYDKVFRFFTNLGETVPDGPKDNHLSVMLNEERLNGVADRDPNAKRDDFNYFRYPFFYVFDLRNIIKPVAVREWKCKDPKRPVPKPWPYITDSSYGHSLFQLDPIDMMDERKVKKRKLRDQQNSQYRERLRLVYSKSNTRRYTHDGVEIDTSEDDTVSMDVTNDSTTNIDDNITGITNNSKNHNNNNNNNNTVHKAEMPPPIPLPPRLLMRQDSLFQNKFMEPTQRDGFEIQASGFNGSVSQQSADNSQATKNGLAPSGSTVQSKQLSTLQKKIVEKKKLSQSQSTLNNNSKQKVPGYCENCKTHFDDFDEHIVGINHREFAQEPENFEEIDQLIEALRQRVKNKQ